MTYEDVAAFLADAAGTAAPASGTVPFVSDIGTTIAEGWTSIKTAANGVTQSVNTIANAGYSTGTALLAMDVGAVGAAITPLLGVGAGVALYNLAPDFWTATANDLMAAGETIGGKVVAFLDESAKPIFSENTIDIFKQNLQKFNVYENTSYEADVSGGLLDLQAPVRGGYIPTTHLSPLGILRTSYKFGTITVNNTLCSWNFRTEDYGALPDNFRAFGIYDTAGSLKHIGFCARESFKAFAEFIDMGSNTSIGGTAYDLSSIHEFTYNNETVYYYDERLPYQATCNYFNNAANAVSAIAWALCYGTNIAVNNYIDSAATLPTDYDNISDFMDALGVGGVSLPVEGDVTGYPLNPTADGTQEGAIDDNIPYEKLWEWLMDPTVDLTGVSDIINELIDGIAVDPTVPYDNVSNPTAATDVPADPPAPPGWEWDVPTAVLPEVVTGNSGKLFEVYSVTAADLNTLGGYLWSSSILETLQKIWSNPLEGCIALFRVWAAPTTGASKQVYLGNTAIPGLSCPVVSNQFKRINLGSVNISELNHNVGDYAPYTQVSIYLPFIGIQELDTDEVMAGALNVQYVVDMWTGTCIAELRLTKSGSSNGTLLYVYTGNMAQQIPLTSSTFNGMFSALLAAGGAITSVASGGSLMPAMAMGVGGLLTHDMVHVQRSGVISANAGIMSDRTPRIILSRRNIYNATAYNELSGYPANKTKYLGNCYGFTRVRAINLRVNCTDSERMEIEGLLNKGVIF